MVIILISILVLQDAVAEVDGVLALVVGAQVCRVWSSERKVCVPAFAVTADPLVLCALVHTPADDGNLVSTLRDVHLGPPKGAVDDAGVLAKIPGRAGKFGSDTPVLETLKRVSPPANLPPPHGALDKWVADGVVRTIAGVPFGAFARRDRNVHLAPVVGCALAVAAWVALAASITQDIDVGFHADLVWTAGVVGATALVACHVEPALVHHAVPVDVQRTVCNIGDGADCVANASLVHSTVGIASAPGSRGGAPHGLEPWESRALGLRHEPKQHDPRP
mmetsp:Transcript_6198/g.15833  ORF Transcript_6198/g.15833 Transcript_6198/m.15833 type:complete len:278 (-) Transcript_6198:2263-3096(-)